MNSVLVCLLLAGMYFSINLGMPLLPVNALLKSYVIQPALWLGVVWAMMRLPKCRTARKLTERSTMISLAAVIGILQVMLYVIGGLFSKFGKSPSSFTPLGITSGLIFTCSTLIGMEVSRAWLVNSLGRRRTFLALCFVTFIYTLLCLPLSQITGLKLQIESTQQINSTWLPLLAENLLATALARLGGARAALIYRGILAAFWWFCPVIPDLPWSLKGLIGAAVPIIGLAILDSLHAPEENRGRSRKKAKANAFPAGLVVTGLASVAIVWFAVGIFPLQPKLVGSGSMSPVFNTGDIVIVAKTSATTVKLGDIIQYRRMENSSPMDILHRVIRIDETGGAKLFITKGDANNAPDVAPVLPENVVGKVIFNIPKAGQVSMLIKKSMGG